jgi:hypothetical protein
LTNMTRSDTYAYTFVKSSGTNFVRNAGVASLEGFQNAVGVSCTVNTITYNATPGLSYIAIGLHETGGVLSEPDYQWNVYRTDLSTIVAVVRVLGVTVGATLSYIT